MCMIFGKNSQMSCQFIEYSVKSKLDQMHYRPKYGDYHHKRSSRVGTADSLETSYTCVLWDPWAPEGGNTEIEWWCCPPWWWQTAGRTHWRPERPPGRNYGWNSHHTQWWYQKPSHLAPSGKSEETTFSVLWKRNNSTETKIQKLNNQNLIHILTYLSRALCMSTFLNLISKLRQSR